MPLVAYAKKTASRATHKSRKLFFFVARRAPALTSSRPLSFTMYLSLPLVLPPQRLCLLFAAGGNYAPQDHDHKDDLKDDIIHDTASTPG